MTTHSDTSSVDSTTVIDTSSYPSRAYTVALWILQGLVAVFLFFSAIMKLTGAEDMVLLFESIGIGQWFRYVTGVIQAVGVALLVAPRFAPFGALLLAATMGGAVITHLFVIGGSALIPFVLFALLLGIAWARRDQLTNPLSR